MHIEDFRDALAIGVDSRKIAAAHEADVDSSILGAISRATPIPVPARRQDWRDRRNQSAVTSVLTDEPKPRKRKRGVRVERAIAAAGQQDGPDAVEAALLRSQRTQRALQQDIRAVERDRARAEVTARLSVEYLEGPAARLSRMRSAALETVRESARHWWADGALVPVCGADVGKASPMRGTPGTVPASVRMLCPDCLYIMGDGERPPVTAGPDPVRWPIKRNRSVE